MLSNSNDNSNKKEESIIQNIRTSQFHAFFGTKNAHFKNMIIDGIEQGESIFNECRNITIEDTNIVLKYCVWNCYNINLYKTTFDVNSDSSIWYCENIEIISCKINNIKACRNCSNLTLKDCIINSENFGWKCKGVKIINCKFSGVTSFFDCSNITIDSTEFNAKYIFQYSDNVKILNCTLDTKDCFWNTKNIYCKNCKFIGQYLGWYTENCLLENCEIDGDAPFCYCKKLKLINCTMPNCEWSFEYSDIDADIKGHIKSIRNIMSGKAVVDSLGEYIQEEQVRECKGIVEIRHKEEKNENK